MIGERIAELRHQAGLSQEDLAQAMQVSRQSVSKWEQNLSSPDLTRVVALARYFQVTTDFLLLEAEENPDEKQDPEESTEGRQEILMPAEESGSSCQESLPPLPEDSPDSVPLCRPYREEAFLEPEEPQRLSLEWAESFTRSLQKLNRQKNTGISLIIGGQVPLVSGLMLLDEWSSLFPQGRIPAAAAVVLGFVLMAAGMSLVVRSSSRLDQLKKQRKQRYVLTRLAAEHLEAVRQAARTCPLRPAGIFLVLTGVGLCAAAAALYEDTLLEDFCFLPVLLGTALAVPMILGDEETSSECRRFLRSGKRAALPA